MHANFVSLYHIKDFCACFIKKKSLYYRAKRESRNKEVV